MPNWLAWPEFGCPKTSTSPAALSEKLPKWTGLEGNYAYANAHFMHRFGGDLSDYIGKPFLVALVKEVLAKCFEAAQTCLGTSRKANARDISQAAGISATLWEF